MWMNGKQVFVSKEKLVSGAAVHVTTSATYR